MQRIGMNIKHRRRDKLQQTTSGFPTMKFSGLFVILCIVGPIAVNTKKNSDWVSYKLKFNKNYTFEEDLHRQRIFHQNLESITEHNERYLRKLESYTKGINQFTDLSFEDRIQLGNVLLPFNKPSTRKPELTSARLLFDAPLPESFSWVEKGAVTPVKDQQKCASCYAFGSIVVFEAQYFLKTGLLRNLSEQNLIDCAPHNFGCLGGFHEECFQYAYNYGVMFQEEYEYTATERDSCLFNADLGVFPLDDYIYIESGNEEMILRALATVGPVAVALDDRHFHDYAGGILGNAMGCNETNHVVALVGYGMDKDSGQEYYLAKNSWGDWWGENGYVKIARNVNYCSLADNAMTAMIY